MATNRMVCLEHSSSAASSKHKSSIPPAPPRAPCWVVTVTPRTPARCPSPLAYPPCHRRPERAARRQTPSTRRRCVATTRAAACETRTPSGCLPAPALRCSRLTSFRVGGAASSQRTRRRAGWRAPQRLREPRRSSSGRGCCMLSVSTCADTYVQILRSFRTSLLRSVRYRRRKAACPEAARTMRTGSRTGLGRAVRTAYRGTTGVDLLAASLPEAAHGFMQRALRGTSSSLTFCIDAALI